MPAKKAKAKLENKVQHEVCVYLAGEDRMYTLTDASRAFTAYGNVKNNVKEGWPDVTSHTADLRLYLIECKREVGGELRYKQALTLQKAHKRGILFCIARSVDCVREVEANGIRQSDLDEIAARIAKEARKNAKLKPINQYGF